MNPYESTLHGRCDSISGRRIGGGNLHGTTRGIRDWEQGRICLSTQEKHLRFETSTKGLESENSALPQVNRLRTDLLGSMRLHQQGEGNYSCNVGGRSHHFRKGSQQRQRSQGSARRGIRDEGYGGTQIFSGDSSSSRQGAKDHPHQSTRVQSNHPRTIRHARQQAGQHTSLKRRSTHQSEGYRHLDGPEGIPIDGWQYHVRNARHQTRSGAIDSANLTVLTNAHDETREGSEAVIPIYQWNSGRRDYV